MVPAALSDIVAIIQLDQLARYTVPERGNPCMINTINLRRISAIAITIADAATPELAGNTTNCAVYLASFK